MNCVMCAVKNVNMFGSSGSYSMEQLGLENGSNAKFVLMPVNENGCSRLRSTSGVSEGKMKLEAYMCSNCGFVAFKRSY